MCFGVVIRQENRSPLLIYVLGFFDSAGFLFFYAGSPRQAEKRYQHASLTPWSVVNIMLGCFVNLVQMKDENSVSSRCRKNVAWTLKF